MATAAELHGVAELHHAHLVAVFLAEEGDGPHLACLVDGAVAVFLEGDILANLLVHKVFHLAQLLGCHLLEVREVEAQTVGRDQRAALLDVGAQHLAQGSIQQVGAGVVRLNGAALVDVDAGHELGLHVLRQLLHDVDALVVLALGVDDLHGLLFRDEHALVANLATHLAIERRLVEHEFVERVLLLCDLAVAQYVAGVFRVVVAHELLFALAQFHPVGALHLGGVAGAVLLLLHLGVELVDVHRQAVLAADELSQVEREAVGVEQTEGVGAGEHGLLVSLQLVHGTVQQVDATLQRAQERVFLLFHDAADELLLGLQFGEGVAHLFNQYGQQLVEESFLLAEERVGIAHGTAQDAANHVAGLGVRRQLAVGNREGHGTQVVGADAHSHVRVFLLLRMGALADLLLIRGVFQSRQSLFLLDDGLEHVGVVVRVLALQHAHQTLEAHTRIDDLHLQFLQRAVGLAVVLHEDDVPYLDDLRVVLIDELAAGLAVLLLLGGTRVHVDFRARTAGPRVAHFPEVVVLVAVDDVVGRHVLQPVTGSLVVALQTFRGVAFEDGHVQVFGVQLQHVNQILPSHVDGAFLEIVAKRPVAQHLEHGVVVRVVAHLLQVIVLAAHAQALLRVGPAARFGVALAQYDVLPLVHAGVGEHERGVVLHHHRGRGHNGVALAGKEILE